MYDLYVDGLRDFQRSLLFRKVRRVREGMVGLTSGANAVFHTVYMPLLSAATTQIYTSGSLISSGSYTLDLEAGCVIFNTAPSANVQPEATYYQVDLSESQLKDLLFRAFEEMEARWPRGYRRSSSSSVYTEAVGTETHVYVLAGATVTDPVVGSTTFGASPVQHAFLVACAEYLLAVAQANYAAPNEFSWREDRGMAVDRRGIPRALEEAVARQDKRLAAMVRSAQEEHYGSLAPGAYIGNSSSEDYDDNYDWLTDIKANT